MEGAELGLVLIVRHVGQQLDHVLSLRNGEFRPNLSNEEATKFPLRFKIRWPISVVDRQVRMEKERLHMTSIFNRLNC